MNREQKLDEALEESFPASDPIPFGQQNDVPLEDLKVEKDSRELKKNKKVKNKNTGKALH